MTLEASVTESDVEVSFKATMADDPGAAVIDIAELRDGIRALRAWEARLTDFLVDVLGEDGTVTVPFYGTAEVHTGAHSDQWDDPGLVARVAADAIASRHPDPETGEIEPEGHAVARAILACGAFKYWRKKALRARDIDPAPHLTAGERRVWIGITR